MVVAHDTAIQGAEFTTVSPHTFTHTPIGTPRWVLVFINMAEDATDTITAVTYGGVALTRIAINGFARDTAGEPGATWAYFLGSGIPTGAQTVSVTHGGSAFQKRVVCITGTESLGANCEVVDSNMVQENATNPSVTLNSGTRTAICYASIYSGLADPNVTVGAGMTLLLRNDFVSQSAVSEVETTPTTGSRAVAFTAALDDVAMIAVAIAPVVSGQTVAVSGSMTPTGALTKKVIKTLAGSVTPAGSLVRKMRIALSSVIALVGALDPRLIIKIILGPSKLDSTATLQNYDVTIAATDFISSLSLPDYSTTVPFPANYDKTVILPTDTEVVPW